MGGAVEFTRALPVPAKIDGEHHQPGSAGHAAKGVMPSAAAPGPMAHDEGRSRRLAVVGVRGKIERRGDDRTRAVSASEIVGGSAPEAEGLSVYTRLSHLQIFKKAKYGRLR